MRDAVNSWERENHLSKTFHLSACDWIWAMSSPPLACSSLDFLYAISKQHLEGGREGAQLEPAFLSSLCARLCDCHKANQIQISPLLKSHTSLSPPPTLRPILSKLSTAEQSALLDQICRSFSCNIPGSRSPDYTIKLCIFCISKLKPSSEHKHTTYTLRFMKMSRET